MNEERNINFQFVAPENIHQHEPKTANFIVVEISNENSAHIQEFIKHDALTILITTRGTISVSIEQEKHIIEPNTVIRTIPEHFMVFENTSPDFEGKIMSVNRDLLTLTTTGFSPNTYLYIRQNPIFILTENEIEDILELFFLIKKKVRRNNTISEERVFYCLIMALYYELTECINKRITEEHNLQLSHKENLYKRFLTLLKDNIRKEHSVTFYSNQLCLTPQYVSAVLKELSGMSANKWIDEMLLAEAKILLFSTENNIQQIADQLHFPDQSSFGKFFKKNTGVSPKKFTQKFA